MTRDIGRRATRWLGKHDMLRQLGKSGPRTSAYVVANVLKNLQRIQAQEHDLDSWRRRTMLLEELYKRSSSKSKGAKPARPQDFSPLPATCMILAVLQ